MQKTVIQHENLFTGRDLALDYYDGGSETSIVTFEARNKYLSATDPGPFEKGYGRGVFAKLGFNEFLVKRSRNHWYQTDEIEEVIGIINARAKGTSVITYGGSMGGMAAISFANQLGAKNFIALSPLYDIEAGGEVNDDRWGSESHILDFKHNHIRTGRCRQSTGFVFYCTNNIDREHAACIQRMTSGTLIPLEYGDHPVSFFVNDTYRLKRLVSEIANGEFDVGNFYEVVHQKSALTHYPHERDCDEYIRTGDLEKAIDSMQMAMSANSKIARLPFRLGELMLKTTRFSEAEDAFKRAIGIDPKFSRSHVRLSYVYAAQERWPEAVNEMTRAISIAPDRPEYYLRRGEWLLESKELDKAEISMKRAIELASANSYNWVRLSYVHAARKDYSRAADAMVEAIRIKADHAAYHLRLGECLIKAGYLPAAEEAIREAVALSPDAQHARKRLRAVEAAILRTQSTTVSA